MPPRAHAGISSESTSSVAIGPVELPRDREPDDPEVALLKSINQVRRVANSSLCKGGRPSQRPTPPGTTQKGGIAMASSSRERAPVTRK